MEQLNRISVWSYHIKQPVLFNIIIIIKTEAYFVNLSNIFSESNLLQNF